MKDFEPQCFQHHFFDVSWLNPAPSGELSLRYDKILLPFIFQAKQVNKQITNKSQTTTTKLQKNEISKNSPFSILRVFRLWALERLNDPGKRQSMLYYFKRFGEEVLDEQDRKLLLPWANLNEAEKHSNDGRWAHESPSLSAETTIMNTTSMGPKKRSFVQTRFPSFHIPIAFRANERHKATIRNAHGWGWGWHCWECPSAKTFQNWNSYEDFVRREKEVLDYVWVS